MNFFNIENELTPNCLKQFDDNKFIIWDAVDCLGQLYDFLRNRLNELEKLRKIKVDNVELELEYKKMDTLFHELHKKLGNVYQYEDEVEESGSSFAFEKTYDNDEKPIVLKNLRKEDIRYTPPRLEFLSNSVFENYKNSYDNNDNDDTKALINQAYLLKNDISKYGGKNYSKKKISKKYKNKKVRKTRKQRKQRNNKRKKV
jgi:hypothetical protein